MESCRSEVRRQNKVPLYLIVGFLGSGKTTLLRNLLALYHGLKIGIIVNEFGDLGIDAELLPVGDGIVTTELNGGQIFCSCLSGSFVEAISAHSISDIDILLVEASGLAKPAPLFEILSYAEQKSNGAFTYRGMVCVIDASRFLTLSQSLLTLEEQAAFSDRFIINKTDLVEEAVLDEITRRIHSIKPGAPVVHTAYARIERVFFEGIPNVPPGAQENSEFLGSHPDTPFDVAPDSPKLHPVTYAGWGVHGRPKAVRLSCQYEIPLSGLTCFVDEFAGQTYRIKGTVACVDSGMLFVDCVGESVSLRPASEVFLKTSGAWSSSGQMQLSSGKTGKLPVQDEHSEPWNGTGEQKRILEMDHHPAGLVMIFPGPNYRRNQLIEAWKANTGVDCQIED